MMRPATFIDIETATDNLFLKPSTEAIQILMDTTERDLLRGINEVRQNQHDAGMVAIPEYDPSGGHIEPYIGNVVLSEMSPEEFLYMKIIQARKRLHDIYKPEVEQKNARQLAERTLEQWDMVLITMHAESYGQSYKRGKTVGRHVGRFVAESGRFAIPPILSETAKKFLTAPTEELLETVIEETGVSIMPETFFIL